MASTVNCVLCFEKATGFGGHVHTEKETIIAGFCKTHFKLRQAFQRSGLRPQSPQSKPICKGCYGEWKQQMGVDKSFGQLMYLDRDGFHPVDGFHPIEDLDRDTPFKEE
jgi:hypothetical protein